MIDPVTQKLVCDLRTGSNHVPGCEHQRPQPVAAQIAAAPGLSIDLSVAITRVGRKRCPVCRRKRVLLALTAFAVDQPIGYGSAKCLECAGLRERER